MSDKENTTKQPLNIKKIAKIINELNKDKDEILKDLQNEMGDGDEKIVDGIDGILEKLYNQINECNISYSDSYAIFKKYQKDEAKDKEERKERRENFRKNLDLLISAAEEKPAKKKLAKKEKTEKVLELLDYINLEFSISEASEKAKKANKKAKKALEKVKKIEMSAITVIGLFSAIIMGCFGGLSFLKEAMEVLKMSSPIRLTFTLSLVGLVLINLIFLIMYMVGKLTDNKICSSCSISESQDCECKCKNQTNFCKLVNKYAYILWINLTLVFLMTVTASIWISTLIFNGQIKATAVIIITLLGVLAFIKIYDVLKRHKKY